MKKISFAIACTVVLSMMTINAAAQTHQLGKANIPFSFSVHDQTYPAGTYEVRQISNDLLRLQEVKSGRGVTLFGGSPIRESVNLKLMFRQYAEGRFLSAIQDDKLGYSAIVPKSQSEREIQKKRTDATIVALQTAR
jgi:hypothetical protein